MNISILKFLVTLSLLTITTNLTADALNEYAIIANGNSQLKQLNRSDLERIFLGKMTLLSNGERILPIMLPLKHQPIAKFVNDFLNRTPTQYRSYWKRRLFSGGGTPPQTLQTQEEMITYIKRNQNAIGVVFRTKESSKLSIKIIE